MWNFSRIILDSMVECIENKFFFPTLVSVISKLFLLYSLLTQCCITWCFPSSLLKQFVRRKGNERRCYLIGEKRGMRLSGVYQSIISTAYQYTFNPIIQIVCIWFQLCLLLKEFCWFLILVNHLIIDKAIVYRYICRSIEIKITHSIFLN